MIFFLWLENRNIQSLVMKYAGAVTINYIKKNFNNLTWDDKCNLACQLACTVSHNDLVITLNNYQKIY